MKKARIIIPLLIIIVSVAFVFFDTSNQTIEDVINQDAATGSISPVEYKIDSIEFNNVIVYLYKAQDGRFGYATIKKDGNSYSLCTIANIDNQMLLDKKEIIDTYSHQGLNFTYGIVVNPKDVVYEYDGNEYALNIIDTESAQIGIFLFFS